MDGGVDQLIEDGVLLRVLAQTEITFSNSLVEAFWRAMKTQWLFLNTLWSAGPSVGSVQGALPSVTRTRRRWAARR
jgi:hypothetical protein